MRLTESEGKLLLTNANLNLPSSVLLAREHASAEQKKKLAELSYPVFVKAQVLYGNRELQGLVRKALDANEALKHTTEILSLTDISGQPIDSVLIETAVDFDQTYYLSISYDTKTRQPVIRFSEQGGTGMDDRGDSITELTLSMIESISNFGPNPALTETVAALFRAFTENDAVLLEINPLVQTPDGTWFCLDAKVELELTASYRHPEWQTYGERSNIGRPPTKREKQANQVSRQDHRGVAGESFFEFEGGEIGVMASGGGASTLAMDALMAEGLKPANYTEYSGNPTREKVADLARVVLSIPHLKALYVVGSNANFTDIYETLAGVIDGLLESEYAERQGFVVLIRRGGPRWEEAFEMVKERLQNRPLLVKLYGPTFSLVETASELSRLLKGSNAIE